MKAEGVMMTVAQSTADTQGQIIVDDMITIHIQSAIVLKEAMAVLGLTAEGGSAGIRLQKG
jgi:hypothetical protein